ncbi:MAG: hypothetical protein M1831_001307 [Alyxoria varia]|nr:MAG: hypothetical protein M1831_001307 [Alyxoria varia]
MLTILFPLLAILPLLTLGQLSGKVGPLTSVPTKRSVKQCSILDHGAQANGKADIASALTSAFDACKNGGIVIIPVGSYTLSTWVKLSGGKAWALQLDGTITRGNNDEGGNMIMIQHTSDFELFSSTSRGAMQGLGYKLHGGGKAAGSRLLRLYDVTDFSVHDVALVDAPMFHFTMDSCKNGEVYNMILRGGDMGGLDGIDVWGENVWVHDVSVTNKDECVTVKSPAKNILIENIHCNWSGGCALGSLSTGTGISAIHYRNIYTWRSNQMLMIKSNGGSGSVSDATFENFIGHGNAYSLNIDQYWSSQKVGDGDGVKLSDLKFLNWTGTEANGQQRGPIKVVCADNAPCTSIAMTDINLWTETGDSQWYSCRSAYGKGYCLRDGSGQNAPAYPASTSTVRSAPTGYQAAKMPNDLATHSWGVTKSIPVPAIPTTFFPGATPVSRLAGGASGGS